MFHKWQKYIYTVRFLLYKDLLVFSQQLVGKLIDVILILFSTVVVFAYFLPQYGLGSEHVGFVAIGAVAGFSFFEIYGRASQMIADLNGDKTILHTLSLPIPSWVVFFYQGLSWATISLINALLLFPIAKVLLLGKLDLNNMNLCKTFILLLCANLFYGFFCLWLCSLIRKISSLNHLFPRILQPMFMFGGYYTSWANVHAISSVAGALHLLNPMIYIMEGMRGAIFGPEGLLPFSLSILALCLFTVFFALDGIKRLQKRLDCSFARSPY